MPKKGSSKKDTPFTSIRIIGKKAQRMITTARAQMKKEQEEEQKSRKRKPKEYEPQEIIVHLSIKSVAQTTLTIIGILVLAWVTFHLRHKLILLALALFVATVVDPGVQRLERWGLPRAVAILIHYFFAIFVLLFLFVSFIPIIATQIEEIARTISQELTPLLTNPEISLPFLAKDSEMNQQFSRMLSTMLQNLSIDQFTADLQLAGQNLSDFASESVRFAARIAGSVVNFVVSFIIVLVLSFFLQMEKEKIVYWFRSFLPAKYLQYADKKSEAIHTKIGQWMRGELVLMCSIFMLTLIALSILGMDYALTLSVLAGFCELIPAVGPFIAAIPALLIAGTQKGVIWIPIMAGVYYIIQWCENNLLVPLVMRRAVGLSPVAIVFAMLVGVSFPDTIHPVLGIMLAVPSTTILTLFLEDWREHRE